MIETFKRFVGKVCTVVTAPTSLPPLDAMRHARFFTGRVVEVAGGVLIEYTDGGSAFFPFPIIGLVEEPVVRKGDPAYDKVKAEVQKTPPAGVPTGSTYIPIEEMTRRVQRMKST